MAIRLALGGEHNGLEDVGILRDGLGNDVLELGVEQVHIGHHGRAYDGCSSPLCDGKCTVQYTYHAHYMLCVPDANSAFTLQTLYLNGVDHDGPNCDGLELGCDEALGTEV